MFDLTTSLLGFAVILAVGILVWIGSLVRRDASLVDRFWGLLFVAAVIAYAVLAPAPPSARRTLTLVLVLVWGLRLAIYLTWRNWGSGEDFRYVAMRRRFGEDRFPLISLPYVFGFQALLAWLVSAPLLAAANGTAPLGWLDVLGVVVFAVGLTFEVVGDWQLSRFKADPSNAGKVMDRGLWGLTRHPNYFGDFAVWWGLFLIGLAAGGWWAVYGPLVMSVLLMRVSGAALLERSLTKTKPKYAEYVRSVNAFFPGPRRRGRGQPDRAAE